MRDDVGDVCVYECLFVQSKRQQQVGILIDSVCVSVGIGGDGGGGKKKSPNDRKHFIAHISLFGCETVNPTCQKENPLAIDQNCVGHSLSVGGVSVRVWFIVPPASQWLLFVFKLAKHNGHCEGWKQQCLCLPLLWKERKITETLYQQSTYFN